MSKSKMEENRTAERVNVDFYKSIIESSPSGYAYHKIILDENDSPCDYEFIGIGRAHV